MNIHVVEDSLKNSTAHECRILKKALDKRVEQLSSKLLQALPVSLRKSYGTSEAISNLILDGSNDYTLFERLGPDLNRDEVMSYCKKAKIILKPLLKAWAPLGVTLGKVYYKANYGGVISAELVLR